jgi:Holliday junction resolvase
MDLESKIQAKLIKQLESEGWYVVKIIQCNKNGFPDLMCLKNGVTKFIEVKRKGNNATPLQLFRHDELRKKGFLVEIYCD